MRDVLRHVTRAPDLEVHWGGDVITGYEVRETVFGDALYALGSLFLVAVLVFVQLRSPFLAMYAMYELLIAFPAVYGLYLYACQVETVNVLTGKLKCLTRVTVMVSNRSGAIFGNWNWRR